MEGITLYIRRCADGKLYTGLTRREVEERVSEHQQGLAAFTRPRRPVALIFNEHYPSSTDGIAAERRIKGWTRAKKLAYIAAEWERLQYLARRRTSSRDRLGALCKTEASEPPGSRRASRLRSACALAFTISRLVDQSHASVLRPRKFVLHLFFSEPYFRIKRGALE